MPPAAPQTRAVPSPGPARRKHESACRASAGRALLVAAEIRSVQARGASGRLAERAAEPTQTTRNGSGAHSTWLWKGRGTQSFHQRFRDLCKSAVQTSSWKVCSMVLHDF